MKKKRREEKKSGRNNERIGRAEVRAQIKKLKRGNAAGEDGINNEA